MQHIVIVIALIVLKVVSIVPVKGQETEWTWANTTTMPIETEGRAKNDNLILLRASLSKKVSLHGFALVSTAGFAEAYAGLGKPVTSFLYTVGYVGIVNNRKQPLRLAGTVLGSFGKYGKYSYLAKVEWGQANGYWYTSYIRKDIGKVLFGIQGRRYLGVGPRIDAKINQILSIWAGIHYDFEFDNWNSAFTIKASFQ